MSYYFKSGHSIYTEQRLEKVGEDEVSELMILSYYNIEHLNLLKKSIRRIKENLFSSRSLDQTKIFLKVKTIS